MSASEIPAGNLHNLAQDERISEIRRVQQKYGDPGCWCDLCWLLQLVTVDRERIEKARAAASWLGEAGRGVLAALDGDPAQTLIRCPTCGLDLSDECPDCREARS